jgi:uracil-DNA glycosylase
MKQNFDVEEIKQKMFEKLEPSGWGKVLKPFIFSFDFENIMNTLWLESSTDNRFTPPLKFIFNAFEKCPIDNLKVVMLGQDPYPKLGVADGIAFSCSNTLELQPSLSYIFDEINKTVYNGYPECTDPNLSRWSNQGILMLNTALTTRVGKIGQHYDIWKPFIAYILDYLNCNHNGLIYVYMGNQAKSWSDYTNENNYKFFVRHPASAAYNNSTWDSQNVFNEVSKLVKDNTNTIIQW